MDRSCESSSQHKQIRQLMFVIHTCLVCVCVHVYIYIYIKREREREKRERKREREREKEREREWMKKSTQKVW